jgi:uncharacterized membrane protein
MLGPIKILPVPRYVFVLGVMMLGVTGVGFSQLLEGLQPAKSGTALAVANGLALIAGGLAVIWEQTRKAGGLVMGAIFVLSLLLLQLPLLVASPLQLTSLVAPAECLALALTGGLIAYPATRPLSQRLCGAMLLIFGAVHLSQHGFIASLIPEWMPIRQVWPWLTGTAMIFAGLALIADKLARPAAATIAAMFLLWIPLVHVRRITADPGSAFEWTFAATAIALAGCLLLAVREHEDPGIAVPGSHAP